MNPYVPTLAFGTLESAVCAIGLGLVAATVVAWQAGSAGRRELLLAVVAGVLTGSVVYGRANHAWRSIENHQDLLDATPVTDLSDQGFITSSACQSCHPDEYASWHRSYHRSMTQLATPETVIGPFNRTLESRNRSYRLSRRGDTFWVNMVDLAWEHGMMEAGERPRPGEALPRVDARVVMTTGSHHHQTYWVAGRGGRELLNLPLVFLREESRFVPREDVFLRPPSMARGMDRWNDNCIECHSTAPLPEKTTAMRTAATHVAELGIACEACHGPGAQHAQLRRNPLQRYRSHLGGSVEDHMINPLDLDHVASTQICGQCHGLNLLRGTPLRSGQRAHGGRDLKDTRLVLRGRDTFLEPEDLADWEVQQQHLLREVPTFFEDRFWPDGMVRISGREHNAMIESACYRLGELSCLSCHSLHRGDANDQLHPDRLGDEACLQCHADYRNRVEEHTHHSAASSGSSCANCHMPHTVYGLLKSIRSHWIDSPSVATELSTGRPNACNLCHLDRSLAWTAEHLQEWYGHDPVHMTTDQETYSDALVKMLSGDANQRALLAWSMGWPPAQHASGLVPAGASGPTAAWAAPYLAHLLDDPYSAVRFIASRSLRGLEPFGNFAYDFVGTAAERGDSRRAALDTYSTWLASQARPLSWGRIEVLFAADGRPDMTTLNRLDAARDDRPVDLRE